MDRATFDSLVKDTLANLYDLSALETHPLITSVFKPPLAFPGTRGEYVRKLFEEAIHQLRPDRKDENDSAPEWRPYLILQRRYINGMGLQELAASLAVSDRQVRRDHHRALQVLSALLWQKIFPDQPLEPPAEEDEDLEAIQAFDLSTRSVDLNEILQGVDRIIHRRLEEAGIRLEIELSAPPVTASADRVVLRQILISMLNSAVPFQVGGVLQVRTYIASSRAIIEMDIPVPAGRALGDTREDDELSRTTRYWAERIKGQIEQSVLSPGGEAIFRRRISLPRPREKTILIVDDQGVAINLFRRLLAQSGLAVVGSNRPEDALPLARQIQPALIILDVMMPVMDGWEVLQTLKLDEETRHIPVLVCSAWEEPELSHSLGAEGFLKKPVTQKMLQDALRRLNI